MNKRLLAAISLLLIPAQNKCMDSDEPRKPATLAMYMEQSQPEKRLRRRRRSREKAQATQSPFSLCCAATAASESTSVRTIALSDGGTANIFPQYRSDAERVQAEAADAEKALALAAVAAELRAYEPRKIQEINAAQGNLADLRALRDYWYKQAQETPRGSSLYNVYMENCGKALHDIQASLNDSRGDIEFQRKYLREEIAIAQQEKKYKEELNLLKKLRDTYSPDCRQELTPLEQQAAQVLEKITREENRNERIKSLEEQIQQTSELACLAQKTEALLQCYQEAPEQYTSEIKKQRDVLIRIVSQQSSLAQGDAQEALLKKLSNLMIH